MKHIGRALNLAVQIAAGLMVEACVTAAVGMAAPPQPRLPVEGSAMQGCRGE